MNDMYPPEGESSEKEKEGVHRLKIEQLLADESPLEEEAPLLQKEPLEPEKAQEHKPKKKRKKKKGFFLFGPPKKRKKKRKKPEESEDTAKEQASLPGKKKKRRKKKKSLLGPFLIKVAFVAVFTALVFTFVLGIHINYGTRMYPFIMDGDLVITYKLEDYNVSDVVAYKSKRTGDIKISRIAAIGENTINVTEVGEFLVNGVRPAENVFYTTLQLEGAAVSFPYKMSADGYFLLDDYRTYGDDSRMFGEVKKEDLKGKVVYVFRRRGI